MIEKQILFSSKVDGNTLNYYEEKAMPLRRIAEFDPDYRTHFGSEDVLGYDLYANSEKVGSVDDLLVDDEGNFRYFVISTGIWIFGKKVLLPIGSARLSHSDRRLYADRLTANQVENLPAYDGNLAIDYDHEENVRSVYRPAAPVESAASVDAVPAIYDRDTYNYDRDPDLYALDDTNHQNLKLYEERLIANKVRRKSGEVAVGKRVETDTQRVSVPVEKERVVIERTASTGATVPVGSDAFAEGPVARVEVYEETADIRKEAFVREEVSVRKEIDRETVESQETLRREELDVTTDGTPVVDNSGDRR